MLTRGEKKRLLIRAKQVLNRNWQGNYTISSPDLYVHQWGWDSAFCAMGYARYDIKRAMQEIKSLFAGQWKNGMLPHIIFRKQPGYFPDAKFWQSEDNPHKPAVPTSGIIQPPMQAIAVWHLYQAAAVKEGGKVKEFVKFIYPYLFKWHQYLMTERDPENSGLATVFHPWESGLDNSPRWDNLLAKIQPKNLSAYQRIDIKRLPADQRPTDEVYDKYIYLVELMKRYGYQVERFYSFFPFKVKDAAFNSILYRANICLRQLAELIGEDSKEIEEWLRRTRHNFWHYFGASDSPGLVYDFDLISRRVVKRRTVAALLSLLTDLLTLKEAQLVRNFMRHAHFCHSQCEHHHYLVTSLPYLEADFNPLNYWRGPIWVNMNWLLIQGLREQGLWDDAEQIKESLLELIFRHGFYEYYSPIDGQGLGASNFSWSAALVIDLLLG